MSALNTLNIMGRNSKALAKSLQQVSSGMKINSAADSPAGYAISERMMVQIASLDQDNQNAKNGQNMLKTAEGAVSSTVNILKTLKEKVIDAANDTNTTFDRKTIQDYLNQAVDQINDNANVTYNGQLLIDGSKNQFISGGVTAVYSNQSLDVKTKFASTLTTLLDRNGNSLNIANGDTVTVSFVANGKTITTHFAVSSKTTIANIFENANKAAGSSGKLTGGVLFASSAKAGMGEGSYIGVGADATSVFTADGASVLSISSNGRGLAHNIAGFTISVSGKDGNIKKSVNSVLDAWQENIVAQNKSNDNSITLQIGTKSNQAIRVGLGDMRAYALGLQGLDIQNGKSGLKTIDVTTRQSANAAINVFDNAINIALKEQTQIGSVENRLDYTQDNLTTASENVQASESTIRDVNMAKAMTEYTKNNVLLQASQAMLAQANQSSQNVLQLLH